MVTVLYLFHEALAQTHNLGEEDRVMREVRAQVADHAERVPAEVFEALCRPRGALVPQWMQHTSPRPFREAGPVRNTQMFQSLRCLI